MVYIVAHSKADILMMVQVKHGLIAQSYLFEYIG